MQIIKDNQRITIINAKLKIVSTNKILKRFREKSKLKAYMISQ